MANADDAKGFYPVGHLTGGEIRTRDYTLAGTVYKGDVIDFGTGGTITAAAAGTDVTAGGVAAEYGVSGDVIPVWDDPNIIFGVQCATALTIANVFETADHVAGSGSALTKLSGHYLDNVGQGQFQIIGLVDSPKNTWGANQDVKVIFAEHAYKLRASI